MSTPNGWRAGVGFISTNDFPTLPDAMAYPMPIFPGAISYGAPPAGLPLFGAPPVPAFLPGLAGFPPFPAFPPWQHHPFGFGPPPPQPATPEAKDVPGAALDGGLRDGIGYLFPRQHALVFASFDGDAVWKEGQAPRFAARKVHCGMAVREFMELMGAKGDQWLVRWPRALWDLRVEVWTLTARSVPRSLSSAMGSGLRARLSSSRAIRRRMRLRSMVGVRKEAPVWERRCLWCFTRSSGYTDFVEDCKKAGGYSFED